MAMFWRILLLAGIPLGVMTAFVTTLSSPVSWVDSTLTAVGASLLIGGMLAGVAHGFVRHVRRSGWTLLLFVCASGASGLFAGAVAYAVASSLPHGRWTRIAAPPEPVRAFTGPTCYRVGGETAAYARAVSGHLYAYKRTGRGEPTWARANALPPPGSDRLCARDSLRVGRAPLKLGHVVARWQIDLRGVDCGGRTHFLLLSDGSMWRWETGSCAIGDVLLLLAYTVLVLVVSLLVAASVIVLKPPMGWPRVARGSEPVAV